MTGFQIDVPLRSRRLRRAQFAQSLQHAIPAIGLVSAGVAALARGAAGFELALAVVEIVTTALLLVTIVRAVRSLREPAPPTHSDHHAIDWVHIWSAAVLFAEVLEHWHVRHRLARPILVTAFITLLLGLLHGRIHAIGQRRRSLRVSDTELYVAGRPFRRLRVRLGEVEAIRVEDRVAEIQTRGGRKRRINLAGLDNGGEVRRALLAAQEKVREHNTRESAQSATDGPRPSASSAADDPRWSA